jgi:GNAT superfamily N-acetyltransferase
MSRFLRLALEQQDEDKRVDALLKLAKQDHFVGASVMDEPPSNMHLIYHEGELAGLCWIKRKSDGYYQVDTIFVDPKFRRQGVTTGFLTMYYANKKGRAWIEADNHASAAAFKKAGFKKKEGGSRMGSTVQRAFDQYVKD